MWIPQYLNIKNLASHEDTVFNYTNSLQIIQGINLDVVDSDEDKSESNGSGKSTLLEGELIILTALFARDAGSISELIREGEPEAEIEMYLKNEFLKSTLKIWRKIYLKKSSELKIWLNEEEIEFATIGDGNNKLLEIIGINKEDLTNYFIISKDRYSSFYGSSDTTKKQIVSRFSNANLIEGVDKLIEKDLEEIQKEIDEKNKEKIKIEGNIETYEKDLEQLNNQNFEEEKQKKIDNLNKSIKDCESSIIVCNNLRVELSRELEKVKKDKAKLDLELKKLEDNKPDYQKEYIRIKKENEELVKTNEGYENTIKKRKLDIKEYEIFLVDLEKIIIGSVTCPKCSHEFNIVDAEISIEKAKEMKPTIEEDIKSETEANEKLQLDIDKNNNKKTANIKEKGDFEKKENEYNKLILDKKNEINKLRKVDNIQLELDTEDSNIITYNKQIDNYKKQIDIIKNSTEDETAKVELGVKIKNLKQELEDIKPIIQEKEDKVYQKKQWIQYFISFKSYLANQAIKNIEGQTNYYLSQMGTELQIKLEGFGLLADNKTVREKITTTVLKNGIPSGSLGKHSGGEKGRVEIATIKALQKLINLSCDSGGLDLLSIDEILESISKRGMTKLIESLLRTNINAKLITHVSLDKEFPSITKVVVKKNGISKLQN